MEMRYFWVTDQVKSRILNVMWHPGKENLGDYLSNHHIGTHHKNVRPWYIHMNNSSRLLPRAQAPNTLRGCAGTLEYGYIKLAPLHRVPLMGQSILEQ